MYLKEDEEGFKRKVEEAAFIDLCANSFSAEHQEDHLPAFAPFASVWFPS